MIELNTKIPDGAGELIDAMVGTVYGESRPAVVKFIILSWLHTNYATVREIAHEMGSTGEKDTRGR